MANVLYLDCFSGAAGDMLLGALLDLGCDTDVFRELLEALPIDEVEVNIEPVMRGAVQAQLISFSATHDHPHRHWTDIDEMLAASSLPARAKENARKVFRRLAEAEAHVHGHEPETVHFHEVGAVDAIMDIAGFCLAIERMSIDRIVCSPLPLGAGQIQTAHGMLPLPAPATAILLAGAEVYAYPLPVETVTPTGAAIISTLAEGFGPLPSMVLRGVGYGAGTRVDAAGPPNVLRALLGEDRPLPETAEPTYVIEANIDDMNPEYFAPLAQRLEAAGALDVTLIPCTMKHGRPGVLLKIVGVQSQLDELIAATFTHSTTLGLRYYRTERAACERKVETVETEYGPVRVKHAYYQGALVNSKPEYADLLKLGVPLPLAQAAAFKAMGKK